VYLLLENFASLRGAPCRIRIEETEPIPGKRSWKVFVFQIHSEIYDSAIHVYEDDEGMFPRSLKDVLQHVFLQSCQRSALRNAAVPQSVHVHDPELESVDGVFARA
jgi:hypothetical protein